MAMALEPWHHSYHHPPSACDTSDERGYLLAMQGSIQFELCVQKLNQEGRRAAGKEGRKGRRVNRLK